MATARRRGRRPWAIGLVLVALAGPLAGCGDDGDGGGTGAGGASGDPTTTTTFPVAEGVCKIGLAGFELLARAVLHRESEVLGSELAAGVCKLVVQELIARPDQVTPYDVIVDGTPITGLTGNGLTSSAGPDSTCDSWPYAYARDWCHDGLIGPPGALGP